MAKKLCKYLNVKMPKIVKNSDEVVMWPERKFDYESDAKEFLEKEREKAKAEFEEQKVKFHVDRTGKFGPSYEVFVDEDGKPWSVLMTRVDLSKGLYGDYLFYVMQLLFEKN
eukprot:CAMPEP_0202980396 /NCGR_PEP_ID=MMETSP1396-20130829/86336_1 /ASSEMBLY_ACC=CAM_ASM_000872 /TAXON_ID= /ORGANISM="Pseudokeronopsis sp., Strain Brazil" /LENGTH=111 /DNA_ID=CAMNT_0049720357 /DNA_START=45 /DNA_END=380 /DNA_ORIENTATION=-